MMKNRILLLISISLFFLACQNTTKETAETSPEVEETSFAPDAPASFFKVLDAHGGLKKWQSQQSMHYVIPSKGETSQIDLPNRKVLLKSDNYSIGYDGKEVWLKQDENHFKGSARFYHNLYFYFIAMPFVLADPGITYEEVSPLAFDGVEYPGIKIFYGENVGDSPEDNYILYYHPETHQMAWLAYTVTYQSGEPSDDFNLIRYSDWKKVNGLQLPHKLQWHTFVDGAPGEPVRDPMHISGVRLSEENLEAGVFAQPEGAEVETD